ncbi:MAG: right-handed parallel beta-helix repeat-containing protein [Betaproteobacteria bacterium]|nr:right-handed parallel beta-helix repeat-containing protein [Betaproteobacteria bacterium]
MSRSSLAVFLLSLAAAFSASAAQRTFVSTSGNDANTASNCSKTVPCRGFAAALTVTDTGGEIIVQDSGGYGPVTINKSLSIIAPDGVYAGISVFSGDGITIATPGIHVVLRGLHINHIGGDGNGINMSAGNSLVVQNCVITNFNAPFGSGGSGLLVSSDALVRVLDSLLLGNRFGARFWAGKSVLVSGSRLLENSLYGIAVEATGTPTRVVVSRSEASGNGGGGFQAHSSFGSQAQLIVKDSVATRNGSGVLVHSGEGSTLASVSNSLMTDNNYGLLVMGESAKLVASGNKITLNGTGLATMSQGVLQSTGDNTVSDNTTAVSGTITSHANM